MHAVTLLPDVAFRRNIFCFVSSVCYFIKLVRGASCCDLASLAVMAIVFNSMDQQTHFQAFFVHCRNVMAQHKTILLCGTAKCAMEAGCAVAYCLIKSLIFVVDVLCDSLGSTVKLPSLINSPGHQGQ